MEYSHISQAVLVLWDLQKMYFFAQGTVSSELNVAHQNYSNNLINHPDFCSLIKLAKENINYFDAESFSCLLLYLSKLGVYVNLDNLEFFNKAQELINTNNSLSVISRIIIVLRMEPTLGSLLSVQNVITLVLSELDNCVSLENLKLVTICLHHLQQMVTKDILQKYMKKVKELISKSTIDHSTYRALLKIISFLNYPKWSDKCTTLSSEIILLMKNNLHKVNMYDLCILFEALYKNHEPGELLTEMQRCSRSFIHSEDDSNIPVEIKLKLFSCMASFCSSINRSDYEKLVFRFLDYPLNLISILDLLRILTFIKTSNVTVNEKFWNKALNTLKQNNAYEDVDILLKFCQKYMNYNNDVHYRCKKFEKTVLNWLEDELKHGILFMIPSKLSIAGSFIFAYERRNGQFQAALNKIYDNLDQFNHLDCLYISKGIRNLETGDHLTNDQLHNLCDALDKTVQRNILSINDFTQNNFLLKSCVYRRCFKRELIDNIFFNFKSNEPLSSMSIRNIIVGLLFTNTLLPVLMESLCNYVISYREHLLGFNAEKVAYLCYYLGYTPNNSDSLFEVIADTIIRDQERISGLSYIQAALSLCFFNKLPDSWIKQIFNVNFLEKLDLELSTCYFKDRYPVRVRHSMMHLNRAVCLDYPQANVPWFHQKYIEHSQRAKPPIKRFAEVKQYLLHIVQDSDLLLENVRTAYGYHMDFLVHLDNNGRYIKPNSQDGGTKVAILLMKEDTYTAINVQLKGQQQLKKRHLEILGYHVLPINLNDWKSLIAGEEKIEFLSKLIPKSNIPNQTEYIVER